RLGYAGPKATPVLDVYSLDGERHFGYWILSAQQGKAAWEADVTLKLGEAVEVREDGGSPLNGWVGDTRDGAYRAYLFLWQGETVLRSIPIFEFSINGATVESFKELLKGPFIG
ncbi:MAG: hypothetical protein HW403_314, partial [Dehalococcoidia bacterium]|nr:hypothetical protein [Dehalococcoidia bacterium]